MKLLGRFLSSFMVLAILCTPQNVQAAASTAEPAMLINTGVNGSWVNPEANSQGLVIEVLPSLNLIVAYWFTFSMQGGEREWFLVLGDINGAGADMVIYRVEGGVFNQDSLTEEVRWGSARIDFDDCLHARFEFQADAEGTQGGFDADRLTPDVSCGAQLAAAHTTFVSAGNSWIDAAGEWVFDGCVELGPGESHGREIFRFEEGLLSFDIDRYAAAGCQGPVQVQSMSFKVSRIDKAEVTLGQDTVIANRVLLTDMDTMAVVRQIFYFDKEQDPVQMTHGNFDGPLDTEGFPASLHEIFFQPQP